MADEIKSITFDEAVTEKLQPLLDHGNRLLLSYDDGVGPYSHHGLMALQVSFQFVVVGADANVDDYQAALTSALGPVLYKGYSGEFLGQDLHASFNKLMHTIRLTDAGEQIDDNVEVVVDESAAK
ncbi:iron-sulfur cluster biosynthesis family protein [Furfurilactobacillus siliginis]|uniref:Core domain-containing protein n=1 Tax=Furfurilactobacillus siliginis TaxID=348151 RepID=A0A0R2L5Y9_9LACO|nr:iron-sulfur cluster biosynthesis family protein [Furfurilactobacillus siliginis]KRN96994.1 hypothetical protein IV55_GL000870 [Furfurilactobacillus siliginis]GEK27753.1 hypothetical protein LSI01_00640 [Furfurilactobacillus siliginis]